MPLQHRPAEIRLLNETQGTVLATDVEVASWLWARAKGLLGRQALEPGQALILERCRSIHTIGMRFPIDVVFVDRSWKVVAFDTHVGPGRIIGPFWNALAAVEIEAGSLKRSPVQITDQLRLTTRDCS